MKAYRKSYSLHEEVPVYITNGDNVLLLPAKLLTQQDMYLYCTYQFTEEDSEIMHKAGRVPSLIPKEINIKEIMVTIFHNLNENDRVFEIVCEYAFRSADTQLFSCLLLVQAQYFDLHNKMPALDLFFLFFNSGKM